jgi:hypothetical protein
MSVQKFVDLTDITGVRFRCEGCSSHDSLPRDHVAMGQAIEKFVAGHIHRDGESIGTAQQDIQKLNGALSRVFTQDLPQISEILKRRKLTIEFEVGPDQRFA